MSPLTLFHNKHELPLGPIPMIYHPLKTLRTLHITDVMIILDRHRAGRIMEMLGDGNEFGLSISYRIQSGAGGIAEALLLTQDFVGKRDAYVILGDNIFESREFSRDITLFTDGLVFLKEVSNAKDYGVAQIRGRRVISIEEKPQNPKTSLAVTGAEHDLQLG